MRLNLRSVTGQTIVVDGIDATGTVADLKKTIETQQNIPRELQRLIYRGRELCDGKAIAESGVADDDVLHLVMRPQRELTDADVAELLQDDDSAPHPPSMVIHMTPLYQVPDRFDHGLSGLSLRARKVYKRSLDVRILAITNFVILWVSMLMYSPILVLVSLFSLMAYFGAATYRVWILYAYQVVTVAIASFTMVRMGQNRIAWFVGMVVFLVHAHIIVQVQLFIWAIHKLSPEEVVQLRTLEHPRGDLPLQPAEPAA
ncbi:Ubiquitin-like domain-containing protein [Plasmodiophora brassicae]|uniref:Ubiquitin-like domain-containing protein n=1 Tax=Plasmodiophora brassicae TaxID=37360 RepID=A0A0G4IPX3_PLABS|nr:hypothetical protein PBRA_000595 [Plasmodiophora brassicae]SPQ97558.1 unnamed protein product [Plasmodiophora brassicae]